jgi:hypothetical protein
MEPVDDVVVGRIQARIKARERAKVICELILDEQKQFVDVVGLSQFWETIRGILPSKPEPPAKPNAVKPFTDDEATRFGKTPVPYGEFKGLPVDQAPLDRLEWYADQKFTDNLRRYLASRRIRTEPRAEQEDD